MHSKRERLGHRSCVSRCSDVGEYWLSCFSESADFLSRCPQDFRQRSLASPRNTKQPRTEKKAAVKRRREGGMCNLCVATPAKMEPIGSCRRHHSSDWCASVHVAALGEEKLPFSWLEDRKPSSSEAFAASTISTVSTFLHQWCLKSLFFFFPAKDGTAKLSPYGCWTVWFFFFSFFSFLFFF